MPIVLKLQVGTATPLLRGQDHYWSVMREFSGQGQFFSVGDVWKRSNSGHRSTVAGYMRDLEQAGYLERTGDPHARSRRRAEPLYRIARAQATAPKISSAGETPKQGLAQQNMWNVMRRQRDGWTAPELAVLASTDDVSVSRATALAYCTRLQQAGLLVVMSKGGPARARRWRLKGTANTGPKPPMILRSKMVYDQNTARVVGEVLAEEDRP